MYTNNVFIDAANVQIFFYLKCIEMSVFKQDENKKKASVS